MSTSQLYNQSRMEKFQYLFQEQQNYKFNQEIELDYFILSIHLFLYFIFRIFFYLQMQKKFINLLIYFTTLLFIINCAKQLQNQINGPNNTVSGTGNIVSGTGNIVSGTGNIVGQLTDQDLKKLQKQLQSRFSSHNFDKNILHEIQPPPQEIYQKKKFQLKKKYENKDQNKDAPGPTLINISQLLNQKDKNKISQAILDIQLKSHNVRNKSTKNDSSLKQNEKISKMDINEQINGSHIGIHQQKQNQNAQKSNILSQYKNLLIQNFFANKKTMQKQNQIEVVSVQNRSQDISPVRIQTDQQIKNNSDILIKYSLLLMTIIISILN